MELGQMIAQADQLDASLRDMKAHGNLTEVELNLIDDFCDTIWGE